MSTIKNTFRHISDDLKSSIMKNRGGQEVIARILDAYGFTSRQALCNHLGISQSTMANRYARDTFPADWVVICSIETGAAIEWIASGSCSSAQSESSLGIPNSQPHDDLAKGDATSHHEFPNEIELDFSQGGKAAIERLVEAYGFSSRQALADHLGISKSTLANRYMRDTFPADWIIQCALETGVSLRWLSTAQGPAQIDEKSQIKSLNKEILDNGKLSVLGYLLFDSSILPKDMDGISAVKSEDAIYIVKRGESDIRDGLWMIAIDGIYSLRELSRLPHNRVILESKTNKIECNISDIDIVARVIMTCK